MDGIIFDIDGTLWDSTPEVAESWNEALRENTDIKMVLTPEILRKEFGKPLKEILEDLFPDEGQEFRTIFGQAFQTAQQYKYSGLWFPGHWN